ncbi:MAG TPA: hypothetical protein VFK06_15950 [Candidatus Angelobacter sp.]|nr:hypothetical protein [Candidatus Angelobacter sp.]
MTRFEPFGPFKMPVDGVIIDKKKESKLWEEVEGKRPGLSNAIGCYVFGIRAGKGVKPWYVGKAEKSSFRKETLADHKLLKYVLALQNRARGYLLAKETTGGRLAKPGKNGSRSIQALEEMLIGTCLLRNSKLLNKNNTKRHKIEVPGYMNESPGARSTSARNLAYLLGTAKI